MVIMAFYLLGNIADTYLTPVLTKISKAMDLSETIAGVTLLAFANGAPDIIASITAADAGEEDDPSGVYIGAGALFGAAIFGGTVVLGYCIIKSPSEVKMPSGEWMRDLIFYLIAALTILVYGYIGKISFTMSLCFLGIYGVYFALVLIVLSLITE